MVGRRRCPGCGLVLPQIDGFGDERTAASPECWAVYLEVAAFESEHPALFADHQLLVDAYGAQHARGPGSIRLPYSLVGLHLALDGGWTGLAVRSLHGRMSTPQADWPRFQRPADLGGRTILGVAERGARAASPSGHEAALRTWAADVWAAWAPAHEAVRDLAHRFLPR
jgi:hypothetical protein